MESTGRVNIWLADAYETIWRYRLIVVLVAIGSIVAAIPLVNSIPREYMASVNILGVNGNTRDDPTFSSPDLPSIATSTVVLDRVLSRLELDIPLIAMKRRITVKPPPYRSSIMKIEFVDSQPERAALIANGIADELIRYYSQISTSRYDSDLGALNSELEKQRERITKIDFQVRAQGYIGSSSFDDKGNDSAPLQLGSFETEKQLASSVLQGDEAHLRAVALDSQARLKLLRRDVLKNDDRYQSLQTAASLSAAQLAQFRAVYTSAFPGLPAAEFKARSLDNAAKKEAQRAMESPDAYSPSVAEAEAEERKAGAVIVADRAKISALDNLIAGEHARLDAMQPLSLLQLERSAAKAEYLSISAHRATALANRADALSLGSVSVVDRAIATEVQMGLSRKALIAISVLISFMLAFAAAFLADSFNPRLRRLSQIENLYGKEVIATLGRR